MPQNISAALKAHYAQTATTVATCWRTVWQDGTVLGFTEHDLNLTFGGTTYVAATGYTRSAIQSSAMMSVDNLDVEGAFDSAGITESDLRAGRWDYAALTIVEVNWADLSMGSRIMRVGTFGEARAGRDRYTIGIRGLAQRLQQEIGRLYGPVDDATLDDPRSGLSIGAYTFTGTLSSVVDSRTFYDTARTQATGYFDRGKFTFLTGLNHGLSRDIKHFENAASEGAFEMQLPFPFPVAASDTYEATAGYDGSLLQSRVKFNNVVNYRGFDTIPGFDQMMTGGR